MVATSNAPSLDLRGLTQPKQNISLSPNKIGIVTLDWNAVSKVNISEQEPPTAEPPDQSLLQVRKCLEEVKSCIEKHKNAAQTAKKNVVTWSWSDCFEVHTCIKKIHNLYMCSWAFGIGLKIPKVSKTPGLHPSWSQRLKSDRPERFWVDVASLTHQGILRDLGMLPRSIENVSTSRWKGLLRNMADISDVKTPTFLKQTLHRKRFQKICDLELVVSACGAGDLRWYM